MRLTALFVAIVLVCGLSTTTGLAQQAAVSGTVSNQRTAIAGVAVTLRADGGRVQETRTDPSGRYVFESAPGGAYELEFVWGGRTVATRQVTVGGQPAQIDVVLTVSDSAAAADDPFHQLATVVVTATRTATELDRAPVSATVLSGAEIEARPQRNVDQQLTMTEGLYVQRTQGPSATDSNVALRGFSGASRTLVLLDGQPLNDSYANSVNWTGIPLDAVDSIEVARGPFSSLYGGNALGGVINIRTRPVDRRQFDLSAEYGTYRSNRVAAGFSDRLFGRLGLSVGMERFRTDGYNSRTFTATPGTGTGTLVTGAIPSLSTAGAPVAIIGEGGQNWLTKRALRAKAEYTLTTATIASFQYLRTDYRYGYEGYRSFLRDAAGAVVDSGAVVYDDGGTRRRLAITPNNFLQGPGEQHSNFYSGTAQHARPSGAALRVDAGFYDIPLYQFRSLGTGNTLTAGPGTRTDGVRRTAHANAQYTWSAPRQAWTAGGETRHETATNRAYALSNWTVKDSALNQTYFAHGSSISQSAYVQDQVSGAGRVSLVAGARYDVWKGYDGISDSFNAIGRRTNYPSRTNKQVTGKLALGYALPSDWNLRASVGTSFRSPNVFDLYATSTTGSGSVLAANPTLAPERVASWEAGLRKRFGRTSTDLAYYQNHVKDLVYRQTDLSVDPTGNYRINMNAGGGRTRGLELSVRHDLAPGLQVRATYTYMNAVITRNPGNPAIVGKRVTFTPDQMGSAQLIATRGRWSGSINGHYTGKVFSTDLNTDRTTNVPGSYSPYFTADASVSYRAARSWQPFVSGENLFNRRYYTFYRSPGRMVYGGLRVRL